MKRCVPALLLFSLFLLSGQPLAGQQLDHVQGELLIQLKPNVAARQLQAAFERFQGRPSGFRLARRLRGPLGIGVWRFDHVHIHEQRLLERLRAHPLVERAQFNHFLFLRSTIPDDPEFVKQWQYFNTGQNGGLAGADFDADLAWNLTTGGRTPAGEEIVVCVIDNGIDPAHEDLRDNLWTNSFEVPDNGIDDDENGYVDDYRGWNTGLENDRIDLEPVDDEHGTPVAGIIGARGNNGRGVSGVNWQVRLMIVAGGTGVESEALEAYAYPLAQRRRYNASNGRSGAFVVATNASWGRDFVDPAEFPLWCALYDTLGAAGILNVAATANEEIDVDTDGDMPTGCASDFLVGVTNLDSNNDKVRQAGYGRYSVDLGAYGEDVWTLRPNDRYGAFGGTSAATPHVTGAVALLYAAPCSRLQYLAQFDPAAAALLAKDVLLRGAVPTSSLEGITRTGGRLNLFNSLALYLDDCSSCQPPSALQAIALSEQQLRLSWYQEAETDRVDLRWRPAGSSDWKVVRNVRSPFELEGLTSCTSYDVQLRGACGTTESNFTPARSFRTAGCCDRPRRFRLAARNARSAVLQWDPVDGAESYHLRLRAPASGEERQLTVRTDIAFFNGLDACTDYEIAIQTVCPEQTSSSGAPIALTTLGCGPCFDLDYCIPDDAEADQEWIAEVQLHTLEHYSGPDRGYGDFTGMPTTQLVRGQTYPIRIVPGFAGQRLFEYHRAWIDLNQDGAFQNAELVFDPGGASLNPVDGSITIPEDAPLGKTRLRMAMKFLDPAAPCGFIDRPFGEYEDYCLFIVAQEQTCGEPLQPDTLAVGPDRATLQWASSQDADEYLCRYRQEGRPEWTVLNLAAPTVELKELAACTTYEVQVKTVCGEWYGPFAEAFAFKTACATALGPGPAGALESVMLFPNPAREQVTLALQLRRGLQRLRITLYDVQGHLLQQQAQRLGPGAHQLPLDLSRLPAGVYYLRLQEEGGPGVIRRIVRME